MKAHPRSTPPAARRRSTLLCLALAGLLATASARAQADASTAQSLSQESAARPMPRTPVILHDPSGVVVDNGRTALSSLLPVYFPALTPVLGAELPAAPAVRDAIWTELGAHVNEPFFAPLSTRHAQGNLNRRLRPRLDAWIESREVLLADLRRHLATPGADLGALAQAQEAALTELATTADELRRELYAGGFLSTNADWNAHRNWQLGDKTRRTAHEQLYDEMSVLRAAIYYQEGLSPDQRGLLRESVIELTEALGRKDTPAFSDSFDPEQIIFFLPHGSRFRVPSGVSPEISAEIAAFTAEKSALRRELREALFTLDRESPGRREQQLRELAARQAARFTALEGAAERIRTGLATAPAALQPPVRPGLPPELTARINAYLQEKADLQSSAERLARPPAPVEKSSRAARTGADSAALADFEQRNRARFSALAAEARAIREEVARVTANPTGDAAGKSVDALLADFLGAFKQQQLLSLYRDYRIAVLQPGLSARQRELLFNAAVAALDLTGIKDWQAVPE